MTATRGLTKRRCVTIWSLLLAVASSLVASAQETHGGVSFSKPSAATQLDSSETETSSFPLSTAPASESQAKQVGAAFSSQGAVFSSIGAADAPPQTSTKAPELFPSAYRQAPLGIANGVSFTSPARSMASQGAAFSSPSGSAIIVSPSNYTPRSRSAFSDLSEVLFDRVDDDDRLRPAFYQEDAQSGGNSEPNTFGEAPEEEPVTNVQFLRQDTILLDPGQIQFEISVQYLNDESDFVLAQITNNGLQIGEGRRRQRLLLVPIEARLGVTTELQFFLNVPFGWSNSELILLASDEFANAGGIGDVSGGFTKELYRGKKNRPSVLFTGAFSAPTGKSSFASSLTTPGSALGEGFWTATTALTFVQTYQPIVFYGGFGYRFRFQNDFENGTVSVRPGGQAFYRLGCGFAVNPKVTFSAAFAGSYIGRSQVNGIPIPGSSREPMQLRLAATIARDKKNSSGKPKTIEPYVNFGLTDGAVDTIFGVSWTH